MKNNHLYLSVFTYLRSENQVPVPTSSITFGKNFMGVHASKVRKL